MIEKRFSIKSGSSIGLSSIYTDNGKVMTQLEVLDVLIKQYETIQTLTKENEQLKKELKRCRNWLNSDKNDYELTLSFIKNKGYSLKDVLEYEKELKSE